MGGIRMDVDPLALLEKPIRIAYKMEKYAPVIHLYFYISEFIYRYEDSLSPRKLQVLVLLLRGLSNKEIARVLNISEDTVKEYSHDIYSVYGLDTRAEVQAQCIQGVLKDIPGDNHEDLVQIFMKRMAVKLTPSEVKCLKLILLGLQDKSIAERMGLSVYTVKGLNKVIRDAFVFPSNLYVTAAYLRFLTRILSRITRSL